ncbi:hopanoid biosynthesis-associated protein HpnK [Mesorhizobium sp. BAC0120]|uniref:hopanoid biosynthesis-associated protein HpnK n=1 Tax=Mesorhizobium sp. BAC0120 TaxID=3090670 RepID=UPI00298BD266|nr:hopanoid biosynthesis-associated protein HpnK [Mesorhizobium sp. BAC0120]MDW6024662.1 hopanoid biosynthesis-associated protein HpnK [Mesorhizobium sp. BAC0120]
MNGLIITADDFGIAEEVNEAVEIAYCKGVLSTASLMVSGPAAAHAAAIARRLPGLRVGLHLALVDGPPAASLHRIPDLVDCEGRLGRNTVRLAVELACRPAVRRQLRREIEAQFAAFQATGLALDHVNAHRHLHVHPLIARELFSVGPVFGMRALRVPLEPVLPPGSDDGPPTVSERVLRPWARMLAWRASREGLVTPDAVFGLRWSGCMHAGRLRRLLEHLPDGLVEIYTHPATADRFAGHSDGYHYAAELSALTDAGVVETLRRSGRRLGGYTRFAHRN